MKTPAVKRELKPSLDRQALFLLAVLAAAAALRLINLGKYGLWVDELLHVFGAKSYLAVGQPLITGHEPYTRAFPITWLTALSFKTLGVSEFSARLPFALISLSFVFVAYRQARRFLSPFLANVLAFVLAFSPFTIELGRMCRMYGAHQLLYFWMSLLVWTGLETTPDKPRAWLPRWVHDLERRWQVDAGTLLIAAAVAAAAVSIQILTFNFGFVLLAYCLIMAAWEGARGGLKAGLTSKYAALIALMAIGSAGVFALESERLLKLIHSAIDRPAWYQATVEGTRFYRNFFTNEYPAFFWLFPVGSYLLIRRHGRKGLWIVLSFAVLYVMHSYVFERKSTRYIFYVFPFFVLGAAAAIEFAAPLVVEGFRRLYPVRGKAVALALLAAFPAINVIGFPWLGNGKNVPFRYGPIDWKNLPPDVRAWTEKRPIIHSNALAHLYYNRRLPDFYAAGERGDNFRYSRIMLEDAAQLKAVLDAHPDATVITDRARLNNRGYFDKEMTALIRSRLRRVDHSGDFRIEIYTGRKSD